GGAGLRGRVRLPSALDQLVDPLGQRSLHRSPPTRQISKICSARFWCLVPVLRRPPRCEDSIPSTGRQVGPGVTGRSPSFAASPESAVREQRDITGNDGVAGGNQSFLDASLPQGIAILYRSWYI